MGDFPSSDHEAQIRANTLLQIINAIEDAKLPEPEEVDGK
jgi:hypothetical protein